MDGILTQKPFPEEYSGHYSHYVELVPEGSILDIFERQSALTHEFFAAIPESMGDHTYGFGKWTIKDIVEHLIDTERIFSTRALRLSRGDKQPLPGFEQDDYIKNAMTFKRTLKDLVEERQLLRLANIKMFRSFEELCFMEKGTVNDNPISVRAILYLLIGHEIHHIKFIKENYL